MTEQQSKNQTDAQKPLLVILSISFSTLAWIILFPTFYVMNIWLLPLHEITAWAQKQVRILETFGLHLDVWSFRSCATSWSAFAPCGLLIIFSISALAASKAYRMLKARDSSQKPGKLLISALVLSIVGLLITGLAFGVSFIYLALYLVVGGY